MLKPCGVLFKACQVQSRGIHASKALSFPLQEYMSISSQRLVWDPRLSWKMIARPKSALCNSSPWCSQVWRWAQQYKSQLLGQPMAEMMALIAWLQSHIPAEDSDPSVTRISHGDFRCALESSSVQAYTSPVVGCEPGGGSNGRAAEPHMQNIGPKRDLQLAWILKVHFCLHVTCTCSVLP